MGSNDRVSVVVTGLGATTPLGGDVASTWSAMLAGTSGVHRLTEPWVDDLPVKIAARAVADPVETVGKPQARKMDRYEQFALVAAREAWADAGAPEVTSSSRWSRPARPGRTRGPPRSTATASASRSPAASAASAPPSPPTTR